MRPRFITAVRIVDNLGASPARCDRRSGRVWVSRPFWQKLSPAQRAFVLLHEWGHIYLNTSDEAAVDAFAFAMYTQLGLSLKESVRALTGVLNYSMREHYDRTKAQLNRALEYDYYVNGNQKIKR